MKKRGLLAVALLVVALGVVLVVPTSATEGDGCTPGYWKQEHHFDSWLPTGYAPGNSLRDVFDSRAPDITLLDALKLKGGRMNALWRHAVAALLNAAHPDVEYPKTTDQVKYGPPGDWGGGVEDVLNGFTDWELQKDHFEMWNELGCPLN